MKLKMISKILVILSYLSVSSTFPNTPFRLMTYNGLNVSASSIPARISYFQTVLQAANPDILVMQEMVDATGSDAILNALNSSGTYYARAPFIDTYDTDNMLFYRTSKVTYVSQDTISTALRAFTEYQVMIGGNPLRIYSCHLKASSGSTNDSLRLAEVTILRNYLNNLPSGTEFIIVGDMNFYSSTELGYQKFIANGADNDGRAADLSPLVGYWHDGLSYASVHTQSPRIDDIGDGGSTGGLDDRFDFILSSYSFNNGTGIEYSANSYTVFGNDGNHMNDSINHMPNTAVSADVANALYHASDHLPVYADFVSMTGTAADPDIIINEILQGSNTGYKDAVELLVIKNSGIDLRNWLITDKSTRTSSQEGVLTFPNNPFLSNLPRFTRVVLVSDEGGTTLPFSQQDTSASGDSMIVLLADSLGGLLKETGEFALSTSDNLALLTGPNITSGTAIDRVSWGGTDTSWIIPWTNNLSLSFGQVAYFTNDGSLHYNNDNGAIGWTSGTPESNHTLGEMNPGQVLTGIKDNSIRNSGYWLAQNYPNPFNPNTTIRYELTKPGLVSLKILNILGQEVKTLVYGYKSAGMHSILWNGKDNLNRSVSSGIYLYKLEMNEYRITRKLILLK